MSNLQIIEGLCSLAEQQAALIRELSDALAQHNALTDAEREAIGAASERFRQILGDEEVNV